jgi:hypothetical protein
VYALPVPSSDTRVVRKLQVERELPRTSCNGESLAPPRSVDRMGMKPTPTRASGTKPRGDSAVAPTTSASPERIVHQISGVIASLPRSHALCERSLMLSKCANPECATSLDDYRLGRLYRFYQSHPGSRPPANTHSVRHDWLCSGCSEIYTLEYRKGRVRLTIRGHKISPGSSPASTDDGRLRSSQPLVLCDTPLVEDSTDLRPGPRSRPTSRK